MNHQYKVKNPKLYHSSSSIHWVVLNPATTHFFRENLLAKSFHVLKIEKEEEGIEKSKVSKSLTSDLSLDNSQLVMTSNQSNISNSQISLYPPIYNPHKNNSQNNK